MLILAGQFHWLESRDGNGFRSLLFSRGLREILV